jgi:hypothetical protein
MRQIPSSKWAPQIHSCTDGPNWRSIAGFPKRFLYDLNSIRKGSSFSDTNLSKYHCMSEFIGHFHQFKP